MLVHFQWAVTSAPPECQHAEMIGFPGGSDGKESARKAGDLGSIPGSGRFPGERNGNLLQYSCLENSMDRGGWWATVHGIAESDTTVTNTFTFTELTPQMTSSESCQGITLMLPRHIRNVSSHFLGCPLKALSPSFRAAAPLLRNIFSG